MPITERRQIEFDRAGVLRALDMGSRDLSRFGLPLLPAEQVTFNPKDAAIDVVFGNGTSATSVTLKNEGLAAILVAFCLKARVPLSRSADKIVSVATDNVLLTFRSELREGCSKPDLEENRAPRKSMVWSRQG